MTRTGNYQSLFTAPAEERLRRFADMRSLYPTRVIRCGPEARALASGPQIDVVYAAEGRRFGIDDFIRRYPATGLLILHRGQVVCERYASGHTPETRWISFSMAKSITSTLVGVALHDGLIESLDDPVVQTVPRLRGSAYDGVRIRDVLRMSTGVGWVETYLDPESDRRKLMALQVQERPGLVLDYLAQPAARRRTRHVLQLQHRRDLPARRDPRRRHPPAALGLSRREDLATLRHASPMPTGSSNRPAARSSRAAASARHCATTVASGCSCWPTASSQAGACCQRAGWRSPRRSCPARGSRRPEDCPGTNRSATATSGGPSRSSRRGESSAHSASSASRSMSTSTRLSSSSCTARGRNRCTTPAGWRATPFSNR